MTQILGAINTGSPEPVYGSIRNLNITQSGPASVSLEWLETEGAGETYVYHNGILSQNPSIPSSGLTALEEGNHNVNVIRLSPEASAPQYQYDMDGQRIRIAWPQADETVQSYRIYLKKDSGDWELTETISERSVEEIDLAYPTTGTGTGRISVPGITVTDQVNTTITLTMLPDSQFSYSYTSNGETVTGTVDYIVIGYLPYGIQVNFLDPVEEYISGDTYQIRVGIATQWLSETLEPGTYDAGVTAVDSFGNESGMLELAGQVYVPDFSDPVAEPTSITYYAVTDAYAMNLALPSGASTINVYTNYNPVTGELEPYVRESAPLISSTGGAVNLTLPEGDFLFYLFPKTVEGMELKDYTLYSVTLPLTLQDQEVLLNAPEELTGAYSGSGGYTLNFVYDYIDGEDLKNLLVYRDGNFVYEIPLDSGDGYPLASFSVSVPDPITATASVFVQALTSKAIEEFVVQFYNEDSETISITVDTVAPTFSGVITGGVS